MAWPTGMPNAATATTTPTPSAATAADCALHFSPPIRISRVASGSSAHNADSAIESPIGVRSC